MKNMPRSINKRQVEEVIDLTFTEIRKSIKKDKRFSMAHFGTFNVRTRKARRGVNPQTGVPITIPTCKTVHFRPAPVLRRGL